MTREEMVDFLVERDINNILQDASDNDFSFLDAILRGEGWIQYNSMTDQQVEREFQIATGEE